LSEELDLYRIFLDTNVVTFYPFLAQPDSFLPSQDRKKPYTFTVLMPVVRELEAIKDEHFSAGQRDRARAFLTRLEDADGDAGVNLTSKSRLQLYWQEPNESMLRDSGHNLNSADDRLIAAAFWCQRYGSKISALISADVGMRVRARHQLNGCHVYGPDEKLRLKRDEDFNLPQLMKATIKELARELADALRQHPS